MAVKDNASARAVVIGDLVASRGTTDRRALHSHVVAVLDSANARLRPVSPLRVTVGDEFQGAFDSLGQAVQATLLLRLAMLVGEPSTDVRFGVAWGSVTQVDVADGIEDGPAWWAAREAVVAVEADAARAGLRERRTAYAAADVAGPDAALVEAGLITRDQLVGALSARSRRLLLGMLEGRPQLDLAEAEGISASAVSQRVRADGLAALVAAHDRMGEVR